MKNFEKLLLLVIIWVICSGVGSKLFPDWEQFKLIIFLICCLIWFMNEKTRNMLFRATSSVMWAGGIVFFTGMYYSIVKTGILYQDLSQELQTPYEVNVMIGDILIKNGIFILLWGGIVRVVLGLVLKREHQ